MKNHSRIHTGEKFKCEKCDYSTPWNFNLKKHNHVHVSEKLKCEKCDYSTASPYNMITHKNVHNGKRFHCKKCGFSTNWRPSLKRHKHIHNLAKSKQGDDQELKITKEVFICKICDLTFLTNMNLKKHNMKHSVTDQQQYSDNQQYSDDQQYSDHNSDYQQQYSCHLCTFSAEQSVNLEAHLLVRHAL